MTTALEIPAVTAVILTQGDRREMLEAAIGSVSEQTYERLDTCVVWNGVKPPASAESNHHHAPTNLGIPEGRNFGASLTQSDLILFLDDDAHLVDRDLVSEAVDHLRAHPDCAVVALHIVAPDGATSSRHVPRIGGRGKDTSGQVTAFLGGACVVRKSAFDDVGGYFGELFYAMEETELAWRLHDAGYTIWYAADLKAEHPKVEPTRHGGAARRTARNRVWISRQSLPVAVGVGYLIVWFAVATARALRGSRLPTETVAGYRDGLANFPGRRKPIRWKTVAKLTRLGRPPII